MGLQGYSDEGRLPRLTPAMWFDEYQYVTMGDVYNFTGNFSLKFEFVLHAQEYYQIRQFFSKGVWNHFENGFSFLTAKPSWHGYGRLACTLGVNGTRHVSPVGTNYFNDSCLHTAVIAVDRQGLLTVTIDGNLEISWDISGFAGQSMETTSPFCLGHYSTVSYADLKGLVRNVEIVEDDVLVGQYHGNGNTDEAWQDLSGNGHHGTVIGSPELCLVHRNGPVIRTDSGGDRYIVR